MKTAHFSSSFKGLFCLILLLSPFSLKAQPTPALSAIILKKSQNLDLKGRILYLADPDSAYSLTNLRMTKKQNWRRFTHSPAFSRGTYWLQFNISNSGNRPKSWRFVQKNAFTKVIDFFAPGPDGNYRLLRSGASIPYRERQTARRALVFSIETPAATTETYYVRFNSDGILNISPFIRSPQTDLEITEISEPIHWVLYGLLIGILLYNLFLLFFLREKLYLFFNLYLAAFLMLLFFLAGFGPLYIWPEFGYDGNIPILVCLLTALIGMNEFTRGFLNLRKESPTANKLLAYFSLLALALMILLPFVEQFFRSIFLCLSAPVYLLITIYMVYRIPTVRRRKRYPLYLINAVALILSVAAASAQALGLLAGDLVSKHGFQIVNIFSFFFISLRLADRVEHLKRKSEEIEQKFAFLMENTGNIIFLMGLDLKFIFANRSFFRRLRLTNTDIKGKGFFDVFYGSEGRSNELAGVLFQETLEKLKRQEENLEFRDTFFPEKDADPIHLEIKLELTEANEFDESEILGTISVITEELFRKHVKNDESIYEINNYFNNVESVCGRLTRNLPAPISLEVKVALREMLFNAIEHGNLQLTFEEKTEALMNKRYFEVLRERRKTPDLEHRSILIESKRNSHGVVFRITDAGDGFDHVHVGEKAEKALRDLLPHGRGIQMARKTFDRVDYNDKGNQVVLVKFFNKDGKQASRQG